MTKLLRVGVIGCGVWGESHLKAYGSHPAVELVAVCDIDEVLLRQRQREYGVSAAFTDYHDLLARDDVAAVSVATPDFLHREIVEAACASGKHVLVEKPMALTVDDCEAMIRSAKAAGVTLMVDFHNRFNPACVKAKDAVAAGRLGTPRMASVKLSDTWWVPTEMWPWSDRTTVGWFLGAHSLDLVRWLFDDEALRVYSVSRSEVLKAKGTNTPDFFQTLIEFRRGGVAYVENSWILSDTHPTIFDFKFEVQGDKGTVRADLSTHRMVQIFDRAGTEYPDMSVVVDIHGRAGGFGIEAIKHFADCVLGAAAPVMTAEDGLHNTALLCAVHESAATGMPVTL